GLVGEGLEQTDLLVGEWSSLGTADLNRPDRGPLPQQWDGERGPKAEPSCELATLGKFRRLGPAIVDMNSPSFQDSSTRAQAAGDWNRVDHRDRPVMRRKPKLIAVTQTHHGVKGLAEPCRVRRDSIEDRLEVGRRVADHAQDLAGRGLLLLRLNQLAVARLELPQRLRLALERLRQALLQVADPGGIVLERLAGNGGLGFLRLRRLLAPTHQPLLASYESVGDRLGERGRVGK